MKRMDQNKRNPKKDPNAADGEPHGLMGKIGHFFNPEPQKEKVLRHEDFNAAGDVYYASVSAGFKVAQRVLWVFFVCFMAITLVFNFREITYDNFFYLIRDFSGLADSGASNYETLSYESDSRQKFSLYRGGLVTVGPGGVSIFTATGRRSLQASSEFSSPYAVCSNRYVMVYDTSGKSFSVYNSFARIYTETLEYPVTDACFAKNGTFAIVTREADSKTVVYVYNKNFKKLAKYRLDAYMIDMAIDSDRNLLTFLYYGIGDGTGNTHLSVRDLTTLEEVANKDLNGEFPMESGFLSNNCFALVTDSSTRILNADFDEIESCNYAGGSVSGFSVSGQGVAVSVISSSKNEIIAFDKSGKLLYNDSVYHSVKDIGIYGDYLFLQTESGVVRMNPATLAEEELSSDNGKMLLYNEKTALICGEAKAEYLIFKGK